MPRIRIIIAFAPAAACVALWAFSYYRFAGAYYLGAEGGPYAFSEVGGIYVGRHGYRRSESFAGWNTLYGDTGTSGATNEAMAGTTVQRWKLVRLLAPFPRSRVFVFPWWLITLVSAAPAIWWWRRSRRRDAERGFAVEPAGRSRP